MNICSEIRDILQELDQDLPAEDIVRAKEYLCHNEFGLVFELICTQIIEYNIKISKQLFHKIEIVSHYLSLNSKVLKQIEIKDNIF